MARLEIKKIPGTRKSPLPKFIAPQLATLVKEPPSGDKWLHELKFDGYRMLCRSDRGNVQLGESIARSYRSIPWYQPERRTAFGEGRRKVRGTISTLVVYSHPCNASELIGYVQTDNTAASSAQLYWENNNNNFNAVEQKTADISIAVAVTVFPGESYR